MKRTAIIFVVAFMLNAAWENLHAFLYAHYMSGEITEFVLLRAALADAVMITIIALPFIFIPALGKRDWIIILLGFVLAIFIELWALNTGRWAYNDLMPVIPIISVGLTPAIQLGLLGYLSFKIQKKDTFLS